MATNVVMPQMGESVVEGTVVRWMKKVGDHVDRDELLFEISTDKVDAEIPSPVAGVVAEILVKEGETVPINHVVAVIASAEEAGATPAPTEPDPGGAVRLGTPLDAPSSASGRPPASRSDADPHAVSAARTRGDAPSTRSTLPSSERMRAEGESPRRHNSPLVRRLAKEHNIDLGQIRGTGLADRVTKHDVLAFIAASGPARADGRRAAGGSGDRVERMSVMRKKIAEHMVLSRRLSAHAHSVFDVNFSRVAQAREALKVEYERAGATLTYLPFIIQAVAKALRAMPLFNASLDGDAIVYHEDVNVGVAVALDWGLIVPVIKHADTVDLLGLSRAVASLAGRARARRLTPDDVAGGTFTITNPGALGTLFGMPIIHQPQVAILGVGVVEKRPVVVDDEVVVRRMAYLSLGYDHRLIDGAVADAFMSRVKATIERWEPAAD